MRMLGLILIGAALSQAQVIRRDPAFNQNFVPRNDDGSSDLVDIGFPVNFFGRIRTACYVNNNGNITFDQALSTFTPFGLTAARREIIAPFFADVDTRNPLSAVVTYGRTTINGRRAFGVNYIDVGYYASHADKLNRFQVVLIERTDTGDNNFDIEFNYERIAWETGDASGGTNGFGGTPAVVGYSNGSGNPDTYFELDGSAASTSFLDGGRRALTRQKRNSDVPGRLVFRARDGGIAPAFQITAAAILREGTVGQFYSAQLSSIGGMPPYRWSITPDTTMIPGVSIDANTGVISGIPTSAGLASFTVNLTARTEDGERTVSTRSSLSVNSPRLQISTTLLNSGVTNRPYSQRLSASGSPGGYRWSIDDATLLPPGVTFGEDGTIGGTPQREGNYGFTASVRSATDENAIPAQRYFRLTIAPASIPLSTGCRLEPATRGVPYSQVLQANGGTGPYTYRLLGQLPTGLTLNTQSGLIEGSPSVTGDYQFGIEVRDARAATQSTTCDFSVWESELTVRGCPLPSTTVGGQVLQRLQVSGGEGPYTWSVLGALPSGVVLTPDGTLRGAARNSGGFLFRVIAADSQGRQTAAACGLTVMPSPLSAGFCTLPEGTEGTPYTQTLNARGGEAPHVWRVLGALPDGITLSGSGVANGVPTKAGEYQFTAYVTDAKGFSTSQQCNMSVKALPMRLESACPLPDASLGTAYSTRLTAVGGQGPYRYSAVGGLPQGVTLTGDGNVSGTPQFIGQRAFQVEVRDSSGATTRQACSLGVKLPDLPAMRVSGVPTTVPAANTTLAPVIELSRAYGLPIQGTLTMELEAETGSQEADANQVDPRVRFANGFNSVPFTIPAGARSLRVPLATTGTVASKLVFRLENLRSSGADITGTATPAITRVPAAAAQLTDACYAKNSAGTWEMIINGFSTTRELEWALVEINGAQERIDLSGYAADYFASSMSIRNGGAFRVSFPFNLRSNGVTANVTIQNAWGRSQVRQARACTAQ